MYVIPQQGSGFLTDGQLQEVDIVDFSILQFNTQSLTDVIFTESSRIHWHCQAFLLNRPPRSAAATFGETKTGAAVPCPYGHSTLVTSKSRTSTKWPAIA